MYLNINIIIYYHYCLLFIIIIIYLPKLKIDSNKQFPLKMSCLCRFIMKLVIVNKTLKNERDIIMIWTF